MHCQATWLFVGVPLVDHFGLWQRIIDLNLLLLRYFFSAYEIFFFQSYCIDIILCNMLHRARSYWLTLATWWMSKLLLKGQWIVQTLTSQVLGGAILLYGFIVLSRWLQFFYLKWYHLDISFAWYFICCNSFLAGWLYSRHGCAFHSRTENGNLTFKVVSANLHTIYWFSSNYILLSTTSQVYSMILYQYWSNTMLSEPELFEFLVLNNQLIIIIAESMFYFKHCIIVNLCMSYIDDKKFWDTLLGV